MKRKALAAVGAAVIFALNGASVFADYGYDGGDYGYGYNEGYGYDDGYSYDYGYDDTWTDQTYDDGTGYGDAGDAVTALESGTDSVLTEADLNKPAVITLVPSKIKNESFTADLKIESNHKITAADLTINYDSNVVKLVNNRINTEAGGEAAAAETQAGTLQYQLTNPAGSDWKESYLTLKFQITELTERSTVLYISVNSLTDETNTELTYRADGTIIQIEGAVEVDPSADESMYTELRVGKSDSPISFESIGLTDVKSAAFTDKSVADLTEGGFSIYKIGITNLTIEHADGTLSYYRLVVADPADLTTPAATEATAPAETVATQQTGITKTETGHSPKKMMYIIIYVVVLVALIAIVVEFFIYYGNPYKKTAEALRSAPPAPKPKRPAVIDDDMFPEAAESTAPAEETEEYEESPADGGVYGEEVYEEDYYDETAPAEDGSEYEEGAFDPEQTEYSEDEEYEEYYDDGTEPEEIYEDEEEFEEYPVDETESESNELPADAEYEENGEQEEK